LPGGLFYLLFLPGAMLNMCLIAMMPGCAPMVHVPFMVSMSVFFVLMLRLCAGKVKAEQCQQGNGQ
jgi:hypothetical protein